MYNQITKNDIEALKSIVGESCVIAGSNINSDYGHDELGSITHMPEVLLRVHSTEEISEIMKYAYEREIPVTVRGSVTVLVGAAVPINGGILM